MAFVKQLVAALKKLGLPINPGIIALILLAIALLALYLSRRRKAKKKAPSISSDASPQVAVQRGPPPIDRDRFVRVWRRFTSELPSIVRRSLRQFQPVVVLGAASAGKSALIARHTDWQRQARYLIGSHLEDPDLSIYLGSRVLVLEVPSPILGSTSTGMREALLRLFRPLFRRRTPIAVVALDPIELSRLPADEVKALADAIRGKINLLSFVRKRPIEVRIALTHLDRLKGFSDLAQLASRERSNLEVSVPRDISEAEVEGHLAEQLAGLRSLRARALLELSSDAYLRVVTFLREAPCALNAVGMFAAELLTREPLSAQPRLTTIHLSSAALPEPASDPFRLPEADPDRLPSPLLRHRVAAGLVGIALCGILAWGYIHERSLWKPAQMALRRYEAEPELRQMPQLEANLRSDIAGFIRHARFPLLFDAAEADAERTLARRIRKDFIGHHLADALSRRKGVRKAIYLKSLADLAEDDPLYSALADDETRARWSSITHLPASMIADYLRAAPALGPHPPPSATLASSVWKQRDDRELEALLLRVARAIEDRELDPSALRALQSQAERLRELIAEVNAGPEAAELLRRLSARKGGSPSLVEALTPYLLELQSPERLGTPERRRELLAFLTLVQETMVSPPPVTRQLLELCEWVGDTLRAPPSASSTEAALAVEVDELELDIGGRLVRESDWLELTRHHHVRQAVEAYLARPRTDRAVFFAPGSELPPITMNPSTRGSYLFSGNTQISGRYTQRALRQKVVPTLECYARVIGPLRRVAPEGAAGLSALISREIDSYAESYSREMDDYFTAFGIETRGSADSLRVVLKRMLRGSSPLTRHLTVVASNARLPPQKPEVQRLLQPLTSRLEMYRALDEVVTSTASGEPALESYLLILRQMLETLEPQTADPESLDAAGPADNDGNDATLRDRSQPAGRLALDILTCRAESYLLMVNRWLEDVELPPSSHRPFLAPVRELYKVGRDQLERVLEEVWSADIRGLLEPVLLRFPFNRGSDHDATPEQMTALFHPATGALARYEARFLAPIRARPEACKLPYRPPRAPAAMQELFAQAKLLSQALWDEKGQARSMRVTMRPVPFEERSLEEQAEKGGVRLTLTYLSGGQVTLVNFNQRPFAKDLEEEWTTVHNAQVGVKLTTVAKRDEIYPDPLVESSYWALLRMLARGRQFNDRFTWILRYRSRSEGSIGDRVTITVSFEAVQDPFRAFDLASTLERDINAFGGWLR